MRIKILPVFLLAALLLCGALAEPVDTEYLVDMASDEVQRLEQRLHELGYLAADFDSVYDADGDSDDADSADAADDDDPFNDGDADEDKDAAPEKEDGGSDDDDPFGSDEDDPFA